MQWDKGWPACYEERQKYQQIEYQIEILSLELISHIRCTRETRVTRDLILIRLKKAYYAKYREPREIVRRPWRIKS